MAYSITEDATGSDFETDFVPSSVLKSFDVGIDRVTSITFGSTNTIPLAVVITNNSPSIKIREELNGETMPYVVGPLYWEQSKGNCFRSKNSNEIIYAGQKPGCKCEITHFTLETHLDEYGCPRASEIQPQRFLNDLYKPDLYVTGVCLTDEGNVAACMVEDHSYMILQHSRRIIRTFDSDCFGAPNGVPYKNLFGNSQELFFDIEFEGRVRLFTYPRRIAQSSEGDFWVVNRTSEHSGNITVTNGTKSKLKFRYNRRVNNTSFDPKDVGNINGSMIIADFRNHLIHLVKDDGTFLQYIMTSKHGLAFPSAVAIDSYDRAWIGCDYGKMHIVRFNKGFE